MSDKEYTCSACGGTFDKGWTDEEALDEKEQMWGDIPLDQCDVICDDCNTKFLEWMKTYGGNA